MMDMELDNRNWVTAVFESPSKAKMPPNYSISPNGRVYLFCTISKENFVRNLNKKVFVPYSLSIAW